MKSLKDKLILALILVIFSVTTGYSVVRYILDAGDVIRFDLVSRYGVDSMAGDGLSGGDTTLWADFGSTSGKVCEGDDSRLPTTDEKAAMTGANSPSASNAFATMSDTSSADTGVQLITATHPIIITGEDQPDISFSDTYTYTHGLDTSLVGYWKFDDKGDVSITGESADADTAYDQTSNDNDGAISGCMWGDTSNDDSAVFGGGLTFDGINDYVDCGNKSSLDITSEITIEAWVKASAIQTGSIIYKSNTYVTNQDYALFVHSNGNVCFRIGNGTSYGTALFAYTTDNWFHIVGTYDGSTLRIYKNGIEEDTDISISGNIDNSANDIIIGRRTVNSTKYFYNGAIDEVVIYNRALSADEIAAHANKYNTWSNFQSTYDSDDDGKIAEAQLALDIGTIQLWKDIQLLAFRQNNYEYMIDGFNNPFDVENEGIDTALSDTYLYNAAGDYYYQETQAASTTELDYMEYANDAAAQAAYVSSDAEKESLNQDELNADISYHFGWGNRLYTGNGFQVSVGGKCTKISCRLKVGVGSPVGTVVAKIYNDNSGEPGSVLATSSTQLDASTVTDSFVTYDFTFSTPANLSISTQYYLIFYYDTADDSNYLHLSVDTSNPYANGVYEYSDDGGSTWGTVSGSDLNFRIYITTVVLQCYSESTIKQQGSYSLKGIAVQTDSLNDTLTRTVSPVIDLTGKTSIKLDTRATITGQNYSVKIHDSGGTTTTHAVTIADTSVYQTDTWDISAVADADKDAIDQILIEIDTADTDNTFYLDNVYGNLPASSGGNMELYTDYFQIGITPVTVKALLFANQTPNSVKLTRTGTGTTLTTASLADTDVESSGLYAYTYTADVSGESSDTCIRALIINSDTTIHLFGISLMGLE